MLMRIALIVAGRRFTGAAAVAEHWCRALHTRNIDAQLFFRCGGNLQWRLDGCRWAHPQLVKERRVPDLLENLRLLRSIPDRFDAVISFLPHDHMLALLSGLQRRIPLIRAYRHPGHLSPDPYHGYLSRHCTAALTPYRLLQQTFRSLAPGTPVETIAAAVEARFHHGPVSRELLRELGITGTRPVLGAVGKLAKDRGFELIIDAVGELSTPVDLLIIGHGEHQAILEARARSRGIPVFWAGKREEDLPDLLRSMQTLFFTAPGSDWGHRLISEAQSCGLPLITTPVSGVEDLVSHGRDALIAEADPHSLAQAFEKIQSDPGIRKLLRRGALRSAAERTFPAVGKKLESFLEIVCCTR